MPSSLNLPKKTMETAKHKILVDLLRDAKSVLQRNNVVFWLDSGTLLGALREGDFIPWDHDIDLGCWKQKDDFEVKQKLKQKFQELGYRVFITDYWLNIHFRDHPDLNLDLNFYTVENGMAVAPASSMKPCLNDFVSKTADRLITFLYDRSFRMKKYNPLFKNLVKMIFVVVNGIFQPLSSVNKARFLEFLIMIRKSFSNHKAEVVTKYFFDDFKELRVFDGHYLIPQKSEEYLEYRYGLDWRVPKRQWDTMTQDGTVKNIA